MNIFSKRSRHRKRDERIQEAYKMLIKQAVGTGDLLADIFDKFDKNKCLPVDVSTMISTLHLYTIIMTDIIANKFTPMDSVVSIRLHLPKLVDTTAEAMDQCMQLLNMTNTEVRMGLWSDTDSVQYSDIEMMQYMITKRQQVSQYLRVLSKARIELSVLSAALLYEMLKITNNFDFISDYYSKDKVVNCDLPLATKYTISFADMRQNKNNEERCKNESNDTAKRCDRK